MTARLSASRTLVGALAAAWLAGVSAPAAAQSITNPDKKIAPAPATKPAPKRPAPAPAQNDWSVNTDLGRYKNTAAEYDRPTGQMIPTGRTPLQTATGDKASVGFASGSIKNGTMDDGRTVPGMERYTQNPSSYVGMSLSVSNSSNTFPIPFMTPSNRRE